MVEGREIAGIFIPFASGVACCTLIPLHSGLYLVSALALAIIGWNIFAIMIVKKTSISRFFIIFYLLGALSYLGETTPSGRIPIKESSFHSFAEKCSSSLKSAIDSVNYPSSESGPMVKALITGDKSFLSGTIVEAFRKSGASHILALSGLHLGILYMMLLWGTAFLGHSPEAVLSRYILILGFSGFFSLMTGASPSIIRAFLFIFLNETAKITGRSKNPVIVLFAALTVQLAINPSVIVSAGFQLSYMAMTGIYLLFPVLEKWYPNSGKNKGGFDGLIARCNPIRKIWSVAAFSISCQIFTAPIAFYHFGTFPKYFLITNMIALPLTSVIMISSVFVTSLSYLGICPTFMILLNDKAISIMVHCLNIISTM